jgi:hypothetical protein
VDPRLRAAVDASHRWYDDVFALHGLRTRRVGGLWTTLDPPPPWHSCVKTVDPGVPVGDVLAAMERHEHGSVADSFGDLDLASSGFTLLFTATWLHRAAVDGAPSGLPRGWSRVTEPDLLLEWNRFHDTEEVLVPAVLADQRFRILVRRDRGQLTGGVVLHDAVTVAGMSNGWALADRPLDWAEVVEAAGREFPGRPVTDYAWGADLPALVAAGFEGLGPQRVWLR